MDEAFSVQTARAIQLHGVPRLPTGHVQWSWLPAHYGMAGSLKAMGIPADDKEGVCPGSESEGRTPDRPWPSRLHFAARWPAAMAGSLLILLTATAAGLLTRSTLAACLAACLVAGSTADIAWSRQARGYALLQLLGMAAIVLALAGIEHGRVRRARHQQGGATAVDPDARGGRPAWPFCAASICLILAILTHRAGYVYWLICAGVFALSPPGEGVGAPPRTDTPSRRFFSHGRSSVIWVSVLLPLLSGALLPAEISQGLAQTMGGLRSQVAAPSYAPFYLSLILEWWGGNVLWLVLGGVSLVATDWRKALPIAGAVLLYLYVLAEKTAWCQIRYLMPVVPLLHLAVAVAPVLVARGLRRSGLSRAWTGAGIAVLCLAWGLTTATQKMTWRPQAKYELGRTEPQADWQDAFRWIGRQTAEPVTVMVLPVFHDLYLGSDAGTKFFLPFTFSGVPGEWQESAPYVRATPVQHLSDLRNISGFVLLDTFSFFTLKNHQIRDWLAQTPSAYVTPDQSVVVWRLPAEPKSNRRAGPDSPRIMQLKTSVAGFDPYAPLARLLPNWSGQNPTLQKSEE